MKRSQSRRRHFAPSWQLVKTAVRCTCGCGVLTFPPGGMWFWPFRPGAIRPILRAVCAVRLYGDDYAEPDRKVVYAGPGSVDVRARQAGGDD